MSERASAWLVRALAGTIMLAGPAAPLDAMAQSAPSSAASEHVARAEITLVSEDPTSDQLMTLIEELLSRQHVAVAISRSARFEPSALLDETATSAVRVFIGVEGDRRARLFVRGPSGRRFLLRPIALAHGLDAVGRELIAQVVESTVETLLASSDSGLTRSQASAELERDAALAPVHVGLAQPVTPLPSASRAPRRTRLRAAPLLALGAGYVASYAGPELDLAQGLGVELAAGLGLGERRLRVRVSAARFLSQRLHVSELNASLGTTSARAELELGQLVAGGQWLALTLGAGVDWARLSPGTARVAALKPAAPHSESIAVLRPGLRYEYTREPWFFALAPFTEIPLAITHFDLRDARAEHRRATPWRVRPAGTALLGVCW